MTKFELYEDGVVWTNGTVGALLISPDVYFWRPFCYFSNGKLDIGEKSFNSASQAFDCAVNTYT